MVYRWLLSLAILSAVGSLALAQNAQQQGEETAGVDLETEVDQQADADLQEASDGEPRTVFNPDIPVDQLAVMVKPLTRAELQVEADAWFVLLRNKARQIAAARLGVKTTNEAMDAGDHDKAEQTLQRAEKIREWVDSEAEQTEEELKQNARQILGDEPPADDAEEDREGPEAARDGAPEASADDEAPSEGALAGSAAEADVESTDDDAADAETADSETTAGETNVAAAEPDAAEGSEADALAEDQSEDVEAEAIKVELLADVNLLQDERTALSDRLEVVLDSLESKGGDVEEYRQYAVAVSGVELDASDAAATWSTLVGWLTSKEGGRRWAWNFGKFFAILLATYCVAKLVARLINWLLERKLKLTQLAENLIASTITNIVMLVGFAIALTALEIDITPIVAAIGATGLVVGLALQGTLSNFASGLMILINRPFDVGDVVTAGGVTGKVRQMNLVSTTFRTFDNQTIHVPNNEIWNNVITNITANNTRRVDLEFGIGYDDDFEKAEDIIRDVVERHELVLDQPEPEVVTHALGDSSVNIVCRPWAKTSDWWKVRTDVTREVKRRFDQAGITIPYPQQDVHFYSNAAGATQPLGVAEAE